MGHAPDSGQFRDALKALFAKATKEGLDSVSVNSGLLHREVGGYPGTNHRMPICCEVMYQEMGKGDEIESRPPKGKGASLTICYTLSRGGGKTERKFFSRLFR